MRTFPIVLVLLTACGGGSATSIDAGGADAADGIQVTVRVTDATGAAMADVQVFTSTGDGALSATATTGADGRATLTHAPGDFSVSAASGDEILTLVQPPAGELTLALDVLPPAVPLGSVAYSISNVPPEAVALTILGPCAEDTVITEATQGSLEISDRCATVDDPMRLVVQATDADNRTVAVAASAPFSVLSDAIVQVDLGDPTETVTIGAVNVHQQPFVGFDVVGFFAIGEHVYQWPCCMNDTLTEAEVVVPAGVYDRVFVGLRSLDVPEAFGLFQGIHGGPLEPGPLTIDLDAYPAGGVFTDLTLDRTTRRVAWTTTSDVALGQHVRVRYQSAAGEIRWRFIVPVGARELLVPEPPHPTLALAGVVHLWVDQVLACSDVTAAGWFADYFHVVGGLTTAPYDADGDSRRYPSRYASRDLDCTLVSASTTIAD
jgi:hypothetical protein